MVKTISYADFERARQMWGEPKLLPHVASYFRTAYQIWARHGKTFSALIVVYPDGGHCRIPIPTKDTKILCESRPSHLPKVLTNSQ